MTREEAKEFLPLIQAYAEGKTIQVFDDIDSKWYDTINGEVLNCNFILPVSKYRIKPEPKYRPFKSQEECWNEMHKHPDFGWVRSKQWGSYALLGNISKVIIRSTDECHKDSMDYIYEAYTFTDGTPFGIKEE